MTADERMRLIGLVFEAVYADARGLTVLTPRDELKP